MPGQSSYHHGNLRTTLLDAAEATLAASGSSALSLRGLARQAGVSHAAPQRHFADRQALLDALAGRGLLRLGTAITNAMDHAAPDWRDQFEAFALAYVRFASEHPALLHLINETKDRPGAPALNELAAETFRRPVSALAAGESGPTRLDTSDPLVQHTVLALLLGLGQLVLDGTVAPPAVEPTVRVSVSIVVDGLRNPTPLR